MSYSISLRKTAEGIEVTGTSSLETIPDGDFHLSGHVYGGPGSAADAISVRGPRGEYAASSAPTPTQREE